MSAGYAVSNLVHQSNVTWEKIGGLEETKRDIKYALGVSLAQKPAGVALEIWGDRVPIDEQLVHALQPEHQKIARLFEPTVRPSLPLLESWSRANCALLALPASIPLPAQALTVPLALSARLCEPPPVAATTVVRPAGGPLWPSELSPQTVSVPLLLTARL